MGTCHAAGVSGIPLYPAVAAVAGAGRRGFIDGHATREAYLDGPVDITPLPDGSLLIADDHNSCLRRLDLGSERITTVKTAGFLGPRCPILIDGGAGLLVSDSGHNKVRMLQLTNAQGVWDVVSPVQDCAIAGTGRAGCVDGPAHIAEFNRPAGMCVAPDGSVLVADTESHAIRRIAARPGKTGLFVTTLVGSGKPGFVDGDAASARLCRPTSVVVDTYGSILIADAGNHAIRALHPPVSGVWDAPGWVLTTLGGSGVAGFRDGVAATDAQLRTPSRLCLGANQELLVSDTGNHAVRALIATPSLSAGSLCQAVLPPAQGDASPVDVGSAGVPPTHVLYMRLRAPSRVRGSAGEVEVAEDVRHVIIAPPAWLAVSGLMATDALPPSAPLHYYRALPAIQSWAAEAAGVPLMQLASVQYVPHNDVLALAAVHARYGRLVTVAGASPLDFAAAAAAGTHGSGRANGLQSPISHMLDRSRRSRADATDRGILSRLGRYVDGPALGVARFKQPLGLCLLPGGSGCVVVADNGNNLIRVMLSQQAVTHCPPVYAHIFTLPLLIAGREASTQVHRIHVAMLAAELGGEEAAAAQAAAAADAAAALSGDMHHVANDARVTVMGGLSPTRVFPRRSDSASAAPSPSTRAVAGYQTFFPHRGASDAHSSPPSPSPSRPPPSPAAVDAFAPNRTSSASVGMRGRGGFSTGAAAAAAGASALPPSLSMLAAPTLAPAPAPSATAPRAAVPPSPRTASLATMTGSSRAPPATASRGRSATRVAGEPAQRSAHSTQSSRQHATASASSVSASRASRSPSATASRTRAFVAGAAAGATRPRIRSPHAGVLTAPRYEDQLGAHRAASIVHYVDSRTALAFEERQSVGELVRNLLLQDAVSGSAAQSMDDMAATGGSAASINSLKRVTTAPVSLINARFTQHTAASAAALRASGRVAVRGVPAFANAAAVVTKQALAPTQACDGSLTAAALMPDAASRAYWSTHSGVLSPSPAAAMRTLSLMHSPYTSTEAPAAAAAAIPGVAVAAGGGVDGGSTSFLHSAVSRSGVDAATERSALSASSTPLSNSMFERLMQSSRPVELLQAFAQSLSASSRDGGVVTTSAGGAPDNGSTRHGTRPLDAAALRKGEASGFDDDEYGGSVRTGGSEVVGDADSPHNAAWEAAGGIDGFASHIAQLEANWGSSSSASASAGVGARTEIGSVRAPTTVSGMRGWVAAAPPPTVPPARRGGGGNGGGSRGRVAHR